MNIYQRRERERDRELYISKKVIFIALKSLQNHIHLKRHWVIKNDFFTIYIYRAKYFMDDVLCVCVYCV